LGFGALTVKRAVAGRWPTAVAVTTVFRRFNLVRSRRFDDEIRRTTLVAPLASPDGDVASGFENAVGGSGDDSITGTPDPNRLVGGLGTDTIDALGGADRVEARDGVADSVDCGTEGEDLGRSWVI
jgi:hypothetical protein